MALVSPGVEVNVIDESFYTPASAGTVPMIFVASAENKQNSSGTGIAQGTLKENAGTPYLLTSQRDLADLFGDPVFQTDNNNNPINGGELNEYGLQAAYSALGVTNRLWVTRADIDLGALEPSAAEPAADPADGTYWLDTAQSAYGVFEWNGASRSDGGQIFESKSVITITDENDLTSAGTENGVYASGDESPKRPKGSIGAVGDYALVFADTTVIRLFYRNSKGNWVLVGSDKWIASYPTVTGSTDTDLENITASRTFDINGSPVTVESTDTLEDVAATITDAGGPPGVSADVVRGALELYSDGTSADTDSTVTGEITLAEREGEDAVLSNLGLEEGTFYPPALQISKHTEVPRFKRIDSVPRPSGSVWIKTTEPGGGARWRMKVYNEGTQLWEQIEAPLYESNAEAIYDLDVTGGGEEIPNGATYVQYNVAGDEFPDATFKVYRRFGVLPTTYTTGEVSGVDQGTYNITVEATQPASEVFEGLFTFDVEVGEFTTDEEAAELFADGVNSSGITGLSASVANGRIRMSHATGGDIRISAADSDTLAEFGFNADDNNISEIPGSDALQISLWGATERSSSTAFYTASDDEVTALTADDTLWYNSVVDEVDLMVHDGFTWVGYRSETSPYYVSDSEERTDPNGPLVSASRPLSQSDGGTLRTGDVWVDTSDIENYPQIYIYDAEIENVPPEQKWQLVDKTDQTSEDGILFADVRYSTSGETSGEAATIQELLESNYLDPDAPDPALYPRGMLLWNLRRSGFNVKRFVRNYIDLQADNPRFNSGEDQDVNESMRNYYPHRWVTESANQNDGSGSFGRIAQRKVVIQGLQAMLNSNEDIRDKESRRFNLMATPGYSELIGEMITLNFDRGLSSFVIGDAPARLTPDATSLNNWATNVANAVEDNLNGLVSRDEYMGIFYPWGFTSDNFGNNVIVPPSHMMLRTMILSDQVSFPWFAPAGTRRGGITNASSVGYINDEGEFVSTVLNEGQRDVLYSNNVNPLTFLTGAGLVNFGQKTRARGASALDRINVSRLVIFLREQLDLLAKPYIFEQNDKITRDEIKQAAESLMLELVGQRALYDFLVVCDESNNTPSRIDRNELYLDIAIEPVKAVEFIYIPLRLKNTGEIEAL